MKPYDVVGLGIASLDLIGVIASEPQIGAKQPLAAWVEDGGGPAATAMVTVARLGGRALLCTAVGTDPYGARIVAGLEREGVATAGVQALPGSSHVAFVLAEPGRDRRTIWWHNDRQVLDAFVPDRAQIASASALLIDTHMPEAAATAARWMREAGGLVMIDAERVKDATLSLLPLCDLLVVSERFGRESTGEERPDAAALALRRRYDRTALVTCGANGCWCAHNGELFHTPALPVEPVDTTGCGDVFHGALLFAILRGDDLRRAIRFASIVAALKTRALGGRAGIPTLEEVNQFT